MHTYLVIDDEDAVVLQRINGGKAHVYGGDIELGFIFGEYFEMDLGITIQDSMFEEAEELGIDADAYSLDPNTDITVSASSFTKNPNVHGYFTLTGKYFNFDLTLAGIITGPMDVAHIVGETDSGGEVVDLVRTQTFFDLNITLGYTIKANMFGTGNTIKLFAGVKNVLNSFQSDFDTGIERDAGYTYGPSYPRHYYFRTELKF